MFIDIRNLQERRQERDSQFEGVRDIRNGYLFAVNGSIEGDRDGLVWFKAIDGNSEPFQVFYNGVIGDIRANMFVKIERNPKDPARWQVIEFDTGIYFDDQSSYEQLPSLSMIPAKEDYEWPPGFPGAKALNIFPRAITDFAVRPTSPASMKARVYSGIYPGATNYARFQGPVNTKDFTADVPGTAGLALLAAISIDSTGTLNYTNGTTFVDGLPMPDASLPAVPASQMLISAIRLVNGMTAIEESNFDLELRPLMANGTVNIKVSDVWESDFGNIVMTIGATGQVTFQPAVDSTTFFQVLDADGGTPIFNIDSTNEALSIKTTTNSYTSEGAVIQTDLFIQGADVINVRTAAFSRDSDTAARSAQNVFLRASAAGGAIADGNAVGDFVFEGHDGTDYNISGQMQFLVDGAVSANTVPMAFVIKTSATNFAGIAERMRIGPTGNVAIGWTSDNLRLSIKVTGTDTVPLVPGDFLPASTSTEASVAFGLVNENAAANYVGLSFQNRPASASGAFVGFEHTANFQGDLFLQIRSASGTSPEVMRWRHSGQVQITSGELEINEITAPGAGAANTARLYAVDNGAGKTQLAVIFNTGAVQILATQP